LSVGRVGLVEACDDAELFGVGLWPAQREWLAAIEGERRMHVLAVGRRGGKSLASALTGLHFCCLRQDLRRYLRPGERGQVVAVATNLRQAEGRGRGFPTACLICDELAHFVDTEGNSAAESVFNALTPSTAQFGSAARIVACLTPWGASGLFSELAVTALEADHRSARSRRRGHAPGLREVRHEGAQGEHGAEARARSVRVGRGAGESPGARVARFVPGAWLRAAAR
jgi:hypothetical protein